MATLYEIDQGILSCIDAETGEIIDENRLSALFMEKDQKIENIALWIKNLLSDAESYAREKETFAKREQAAISKADTLKRFLTNTLAGEKFQTTRCTVSFRRTAKVDVLDEKKIPECYTRTKTEKHPDKKAILAALKAGENISGCALGESLSITVK